MTSVPTANTSDSRISIGIFLQDFVESLWRQVVVVVKVVNCSCQPQGICYPLRTIPATCALYKEWRKLRQDHSRPIIAITLRIIKEFFYGFQLLVGDRYANHVVVFFRFIKRFPAYACRTKRSNTDTSLIGHNKFCMGVVAFSGPADNLIVPMSLTFVKGYTKLLWFCSFSYPIV